MKRNSKRTSGTAFEHDAQLLATIHNQMVALEYGFSSAADMYKNIGQKNYRMYLEPLRKGNKYTSYYEDLYNRGVELRGQNPFLYDLPDKVLKQREADVAAGEKKPDNYYFHMALKDKDFAERYHAWSFFGSIQDNMDWKQYKNLGARVNDIRDEKEKEKRAKQFAESPYYEVVAGLMDSFPGKIGATIRNIYDTVVGNPLRTEEYNDLLTRSMLLYSGKLPFLSEV